MESPKKKFSLDLNGIYFYQQNRPPYLMIDYVEEVAPGKHAKGYKILKEDEWFFKVHWPGDPNMPGLLQIESLVQMCALSILTIPGNEGKVVYLTSADNIKLSKKIVAGNKLYLDTTLLKWKRGIGSCTGTGYIDNSIACKADFTLILPDILNKYNVK